MITQEKMYIGVGGFRVTPKIQEYVLDVLKEGRLSYGYYIPQFEKKFARMHEMPFGIMSNSGTSSLLIALQTLKIHHGWKDGDEVIVPATTFVATPNIVVQNNMRPVFVDIEPDYYGMNPNLIEAKITNKTRCIIPVHLFGMPCQIDKIMEIAKKYNLKVIEDSCETMFADYNGKRIGSFGDIACFSTYVAHIIITGVGGISITSNPEYAVTMRSLINHGRDSIYLNIDDDIDKSDDQLKEVIERRFLFTQIGHSFRVTEFEGALGLAQLEDWEVNIRQRWNNARFLTEHLSDLSEYLQLPKIREGATHSFMMYPIVLKKEHKEKLCFYLESMGIETRDMLPLINQPYYKKTFKDKADYPVSEMILKRGFYIGCHPYITPIMLSHVVQSFKSYYQQKGFTKPVTTALIVITAPDTEVSQKIFSRIDTSPFKKILIFDIYPEKKIGHKFREMKYDVVDIPKKSTLKVYKSILEKVQDDYIILFSLDGSQDPNEIPAITSRIILGYDMVIASRLLPEGKRYDSDNLIPLRGIGNRIITLLLNLVFDSNLSDSYQPFRAVSLDFLRKASLNSKMLTNYQMSIRAVTMKRKISEIPSIEHKSIKRIGVLKALMYGLMTIPLIISEKIRGTKMSKGMMV